MAEVLASAFWFERREGGREGGMGWEAEGELN